MWTCVNVQDVCVRAQGYTLHKQEQEFKLNFRLTTSSQYHFPKFSNIKSLFRNYNFYDVILNITFTLQTVY